MKHAVVPGSIVTKETAPGYIKRIARFLLVEREITMESSYVLDEIESRIVNAGLLDWDTVKRIEEEAVA